MPSCFSNAQQQFSPAEGLRSGGRGAKLDNNRNAARLRASVLALDWSQRGTMMTSAHSHHLTKSACTDTSAPAAAPSTRLARGQRLEAPASAREACSCAEWQPRQTAARSAAGDLRADCQGGCYDGEAGLQQVRRTALYGGFPLPGRLCAAGPRGPGLPPSFLGPQPPRTTLNRHGGAAGYSRRTLQCRPSLRQPLGRPSACPRCSCSAVFWTARRGCGQPLRPTRALPWGVFAA